MAKRIIAIEVDSKDKFTLGLFLNNLSKEMNSDDSVLETRIELSIYGNCTIISYPYEWTMRDSVNHFLRLKGKKELL